MKLQIEKWVEEHKPFEGNATDLFHESVICYKVGAYKSAFLMSYLALKVTIRDRILNCTYRPGLYEGKDVEWQENILKPLIDDDTWEKYLNQIIEADPNPTSKSCNKAIIYFENREETKNEYHYWRNVRNKCAHAKKGTIDSSTVECFWSYLQDNLSMFYVLGGKEYLVERMLEYYKYRDIEENQSKMLLISDINIVYKHDSQEFFKKFLGRANINSYRLINNHNMGFWRDFIESQYEGIQEGFVRVMMSNPNYFIDCYGYFPQILNLAVSLERRFIKDSLSKWMSGHFGRTESRNKVFWDLLFILLKNFSSEIDINQILKIGLGVLNNVDIDDEKLEVLNKHRIFNGFILHSGSYFFDADLEGILITNESKEREIIPWFEYAEWDRKLLISLEWTFSKLNGNIKLLRNAGHSTRVYDRRKEIYCGIIEKYKDRMDSNLIETLDLEDEFKALIVGT